MIRDRIVCGVRDSSLRKKILQVPELTLQKCIDLCRSAEAMSTQLEVMPAQTSHIPLPPEVNFVKTPSKGADKSPIVKDCRFCGHEMERSKCPAFGKISSVCQRENHFALTCSHKKKPHKTKKLPRKHSVKFSLYPASKRSTPWITTQTRSWPLWRLVERRWKC